MFSFLRQAVLHDIAWKAAARWPRWGDDLYQEIQVRFLEHPPPNERYARVMAANVRSEFWRHEGRHGHASFEGARTKLEQDWDSALATTDDLDRALLVREALDVAVAEIQLAGEDMERLVRDALNGKRQKVRDRVALHRFRQRLRAKIDDDHAAKLDTGEGVVVDDRTAQVFVDGEERHLTPVEFRILGALARDPGRTVSLGTLAAVVYDMADIHDMEIAALIKVHMLNIRKKVGKERIVTVRGFGYKLAV